jgi:hypothetical protein
VIIDAGGGTIDAVTYQCTKETPLRLNAEIVEPDSKFVYFLREKDALITC